MKIVSGLALVAALLMTGCASYVDMASQLDSDRAKRFRSPSLGKAGVYVYQDAPWGLAFKKDVRIDGKCLGEAAPNVFLYTQVEGDKKHTLETESGFSFHRSELMFQAGKNYFIRQFLILGLSGVGSRLEQVSEWEGKVAVSRLEMAQPGQCDEPVEAPVVAPVVAPTPVVAPAPAATKESAAPASVPAETKESAAPAPAPEVTPAPAPAPEPVVAPEPAAPKESAAPVPESVVAPEPAVTKESAAPAPEPVVAPAPAATKESAVPAPAPEPVVAPEPAATKESAVPAPAPEVKPAPAAAPVATPAPAPNPAPAAAPASAPQAQ